MLDKQDLQQIQKIVETAVGQSEERIKSELRGEIKESAKGLRGEIRESEDRVVSRVNREIVDLAEVNRAVISKVSIIPELEQRIRRLEQKVGLA